MILPLKFFFFFFSAPFLFRCLFFIFFFSFSSLLLFSSPPFFSPSFLSFQFSNDQLLKVEHYIECCAAKSSAVREMLVRLVNEHAFLALQDPYANAFIDPPSVF